MTLSTNSHFDVIGRDQLYNIFFYTDDLKVLCQLRRVCRVWRQVISNLLASNEFIVNYLIKSYKKTPEDIERWNAKFNTDLVDAITSLVPVIWEELAPDPMRPYALVNFLSEKVDQFLSPTHPSPFFKTSSISSAIKKQSIKLQIDEAMSFLLFKSAVTQVSTLKISLSFVQAYSTLFCDRPTEIELARFEYTSVRPANAERNRDKMNEAVIKCELKLQLELDSFIEVGKSFSLEALGKEKGYKNLSCGNHLTCDAFFTCRNLFLKYETPSYQPTSLSYHCGVCSIE